MTDDEVVLRRTDGATAVGDLDRLLELHAAAFAGPPWHETAESAEATRPRMRALLEHEGTEVVLAEIGDRLVGAAYGWPAADELPDEWIYPQIAAAVGPRVVRERLTGGVLELVELVVHPDAQRRGLGRRLLESARAGRSAWLLTHPDGPGVPLYERAGWHHLADLQTSTGEPMRLYVHPGDVATVSTNP